MEAAETPSRPRIRQGVKRHNFTMVRGSFGKAQMNRMLLMWMFGVPLSVLLLFMVFGIL